MGRTFAPDLLKTVGSSSFGVVLSYPATSGFRWFKAKVVSRHVGAAVTLACPNLFWGDSYC